MKLLSKNLGRKRARAAEEPVFTTRGLYGRLLFAAGAAALGLTLSGCIQTRSYADLRLPRVTPDEIHAENPQPLRLNVEFSFNGKRNESESHRVRSVILGVLEESKLSSNILPGEAPGEARLDIVINEVVNLNPVVAVGEGLVFGLSFGAIGMRTTHNYALTATITPVRGPAVKKTYRQTLYFTAGNRRGPRGLPPKPLEPGINEAIEQLVLHLLQDLQKDAVL